MHVGPERLWRPDIMVYNSVEHFDYETTDLLLTSDGTVRTIKSNSLWIKYDLINLVHHSIPDLVGAASEPAHLV